MILDLLRSKEIVQERFTITDNAYKLSCIVSQ